MFLKSLRALAPWEKGDVDQICQSDFFRDGQIKLDVSVYDVQQADIVRMHAEHQASAPMFMQSGKWLDVTGVLQGVYSAPGSHPFAFVRNAHCNADLPDEQALRVFIGKLVADFKNRVRLIEKKEIKEYVRGRKAAHDLEWLTFLKTTVGQSWDKIC